jgi:hypothetical protein
MVRYIIAAGDITARPKIFKHFRGKVAKECYRCCKGICITRQLIGPVGFAVARIPNEYAKGYIYSGIGSVGEAAFGYIGGMAFVRYIYKATDVAYVKEVFRMAYNVGGLFMTLPSKGWDLAFDSIGLSRLERYWFGEPVYIFNDSRIWLEGNFSTI